MAKNDVQTPKRKYWLIFLILGSLFIFSAMISVLFGGEDSNTLNYNTAIIPISGVITTESDSSIFGSTSAGSTQIVKQIEKAQNDPKVKAVIFEINSPGGSPVASDEISSAILKLKLNKTTVAWIREVGASGAYWVASSSDHIVANKMSIVGSIGVIGSYLEWYGLMNKYNVTYKRLVSGKYKDAGIPYRPLGSDEEMIIQSKLDKIYDVFVNTVAINRNMSNKDVLVLATGEIFLGLEAKDNGLIDELGGKEEAIKYIEQKIAQKAVTKEFTAPKGFIESLINGMNKNSYMIGVGIGDSIKKDDNFKITT